MELTNVMKIWEELHVKDTGEIGFAEFEKAIDEIVGVENDVNPYQPRKPQVDGIDRGV